MTDKHKKEDIRNAPWAQNAPEWLIEVIAQLTENRQANAELLERLLNYEKGLSDKSTILRDSQEALIKAVDDLKDFANSLYGPQSAFAQINEKLDGFSRELETDRRTNYERYRELKTAQEEVDDHMKELEGEFGVLKNKLREFELALDGLKQ